ncbi:folylpolyglutamate synthase [Geopyxis carbonaria]|nr:folylpolyglutamate synthase [Geopyxis carbonaria]
MSTPSSAARTYQDAITALNSLQSNFAVLSAVKASGMNMNLQAMPEMREWVRRIGYTPASFTPLNLLHIAGTKGKGSTAAFASSLLQQHRAAGLIQKTGLFTSPHLRAVRERIQLNGAPLSEPEFARYFFEVWDRLAASAAAEGRDPADRPAYFRFLTLVALHAYVAEGVDSAVIEVGVGGEYDSTNVIAAPTVVGISALGIDHVGVLGVTLPEIAWHKAGIFKPGAEAFSVPQPEEAMAVVRERAAEIGVPLEVVQVHPEIASGAAKLGLAAEFQKENAALALAMVQAHMRKLGHEVPEVRMDAPLPEGVKRGLETVKWDGRCQSVVESAALEWCIDGAHTVESLAAAGTWFGGRTNSAPSRTRILIFNQQNRDAPEKLLHALAVSLKTSLPSTTPLFTYAIFCTNVTFAAGGGGYKPDLMGVGADTKAVAELTVQKALAAAWSEEDPGVQVAVMPTVQEAVEMARGIEGEKVAFVTGSLHLVGGVLEVLDV